MTISRCRPRRINYRSVLPKRLWQVGQEKWHVDAPVTVAGDRVLAATAFLNLEKVGDRRCLSRRQERHHECEPR